jgi:hypothetical protein
MTRMVKGDARLEEIDMLWEITKQIEVRASPVFFVLGCIMSVICLANLCRFALCLGDSYLLSLRCCGCFYAHGVGIGQGR